MKVRLTNSTTTKANAQYSDLVIDRATTLCFLELQDTRFPPKKYTIATSGSSVIWTACPISIREAYKVQLFARLEVKVMSDGPFLVTKYSFTSLPVNISRIL